MTTTDSFDTDHDGHRFALVSAHATSQGRLCYLRCSCGMWQVRRYPGIGRTVTEAVVGAPAVGVDAFATGRDRVAVPAGS
jgi:hypothetical protein